MLRRAKCSPPVARRAVGLAAMVDAAVHCACAVALADAIPELSAIVSQIKRCFIGATLQRGSCVHRTIVSFSRITAVAMAPGVDVNVVSHAAPEIYGCANAEGCARTLTPSL